MFGTLSEIVEAARVADSGLDGIYRFDGFVFEQARGTLRGPDGADLALRPKALALLVHLLGNPGRLLRRNDLLDQLWPGVTVTDDSLTQCVSELRHAFGERASHILRTVPRQGYVMAATVECQAAATPAALKQADLVFLRRAPIALFPFECPGPDPACQHLAVSLVSDLLGELAMFEELRLVPVAHPTAYRMRGEVRSSNGALRVLVRLEAADGTTLWADRFDAPRDEDAELTGRLAITITHQINREDLRCARSTPTAEMTVRQLCLVGQDLHGHGTEADTVEALVVLEQATERDPGYAVAHSWLSYTVQRAVTHGWGGQDVEAARDRTLALARRAVRLEPESPLCLAHLAYALMLHRRWDEALAVARNAVASRYHTSWGTRTTLSEVFTSSGYADEAVALLTSYLPLEPLCPPSTRAMLGRALLLADRPEEALHELRQCVAELPDYGPCYHFLVVAAAETDRLEEARVALREIGRLQPWWTPTSGNEPWQLRRIQDERRFHAAFHKAGLVRNENMGRIRAI